MEWRCRAGVVFLSIPQQDTEINWRPLTLRALVFIQSAQDKVCDCLVFSVLYTVICIISSTILKLHMGLVLFLDKICPHEFIEGYPFFYFYCAGMLKQNHWEQRPMCSTNKEVHRTKRIITLQEVTRVTIGGMLYRIAENEFYNWL